VDAASGYTTTSCKPDLGRWQLQSRYRTRSYQQTMSGTQPLGASWLLSTTEPTVWGNVGACTTTQPRPVAIASVAAEVGIPVGHPAAPVGATVATVIAPTGVSNTDVSALGVSSTSPCAAWPCRGTVVIDDTGSRNSLADVAQYYYATDLRADMTNNVRQAGVPTANPFEDDRAMHQHMSTWVVGLGVSGTLPFTSNTLGDLRSGALNWPVWPTVAVEASSDPLVFSDPRSIDDFWHAAVNGRGQYFRADKAQTLVTGVRDALRDMNSDPGAAASLTPSTSAPTTTDNTAFVPSFTTVAWTGDLQSWAFDLGTMAVAPGSASWWSAQTLLGKRVSASSDTRKIMLRKQEGETDGALSPGDKLTDFSYAGLNASRKSYFIDAAKLELLSQYPLLDATQKSQAAGENLLNFVRGQNGFEGSLYRTRKDVLGDIRVLGDIVGSQPAYVKGPSMGYAESSNPGYTAFKTGAAAARKKMVYVGANDGMLHAFYAPQPGDANWADRGKEAWAYIPSQVLPNLYKLADEQYYANHQFFVDGTVAVGDAYNGSSWRTLLVGGLNAGGKGYYVLDITDPEKPKSLWEYTVADDANLGLSFGRPIISKLTNGEWVVMFTSGYNNADGGGYLYIRNAFTGQNPATTPATTPGKIATGEGSAGAPSGLREINNWVNNVALDNTTQRVYGGDLLGHVWRFDVNGTLGATRLVSLKTGDGAGTAQPITARVELAEIGGDAYVYVGTGRLLGFSDLADTQKQSVYSFKDTGVSYVDADFRSSLRPMVFTTDGAKRSIACVAAGAQCAIKKGWVVDLPEAGERMNIDFKAGKGTLVFVTNVPVTDFCSAGHSWINYVDMVSGAQIGGWDSAGKVLDANAMAVGLTLVDYPGASGAASLLRAYGTSASGAIKDVPIPYGSPAPVGKRISWREIVQ
jgi:Tfp pilus tip-associated adhesin PilY1